jgi:heptosyltransferase-1
LDVARQLGCKVQNVVFPLVTTPKEEEIAEKIMLQAGMNLNNPYIVLPVGANWPNKRWPAKYYAKFADYLYGKNIIPVLIGGGVTDTALAAEITANCEIPPVDLVGKTTLKQLSFIIKNAQAIVGGDTGPMHLAAALKKPLVMIMGPTDINRNGPYGQQENAIEVARECKHCWKRQCQLNIDCLADITVETVVKKLQAVMES